MHEQSETIQRDDGKYVNVYGRNTPKAGQQLPKNETGVGHKVYDNVQDAVREAVQRSNMSPPHEHKSTTPAGQDRNMGEEE